MDITKTNREPTTSTPRSSASTASPSPVSRLPLRSVARRTLWAICKRLAWRGRLSYPLYLTQGIQSSLTLFSGDVHFCMFGASLLATTATATITTWFHDDDGLMDRWMDTLHSFLTDLRTFFCLVSFDFMCQVGASSHAYFA